MICRWGFIGLTSLTDHILPIICSQSRSVWANFSCFASCWHHYSMAIGVLSTRPLYSVTPLHNVDVVWSVFCCSDASWKLIIGVRVCCSFELSRGDFHALEVFAAPSHRWYCNPTTLALRTINTINRMLYLLAQMWQRDEKCTINGSILSFVAIIHGINWHIICSISLVLVWTKHTIQCLHIIWMTCNPFGGIGWGVWVSTIRTKSLEIRWVV